MHVHAYSVVRTLPLAIMCVFLHACHALLDQHRSTSLRAHSLNGGRSFSSCEQGLFTDVAEVAVAEAAVPAGKGKRVAMRDGVDWEVISKAVATRDSKQCMSKWYTQLRPNMTDTSEWSRGDDVKLLKALWAVKADYVRTTQATSCADVNAGFPDAMLVASWPCPCVVLIADACAPWMIMCQSGFSTQSVLAAHSQRNI